MNKIIAQNNEIVTIDYLVTNGTLDSTGVKVIFKIPAGLTVDSMWVNHGVWNPSVRSWVIGSMEPNEAFQAKLKLKVMNINFEPFTITATIETKENNDSVQILKKVVLQRDPEACCDKVMSIFPAYSAQNGSFTARTLTFGDSNISFSTTNGSVVAYLDPHLVHVNGSYTSLGQVMFSNSNNVTFGLSGSVITASAAFNSGDQYNQVLSVSGSSVNFETIYFQNTDGISFSLSSNSLIVSISTNPIHSLYLTGNVSGTQTSMTYLNSVKFSGYGIASVGISGDAIRVLAPMDYVYSINGSSGHVSFINGNGVTIGGTNNQLTFSHDGLTSQSNQAFSAAGGSSAFQTLNFSNANGFTFSNSGGALALSGTKFQVTAPGSTFTDGFSFINANGVSFSGSGNTLSASVGVHGVSSSNGVSLGLSNGYITASVPITTVSNANGLTLGVSNGVLTGSVASTSQSTQIHDIYVDGNTTYTSSGTMDNNLYFYGGDGINIGMSAGSLVVENANAVFDTAYPINVYYNNPNTFNVSTQYNYIFPIQLPNNLNISRIIYPVRYGTSNNSTQLAISNTTGLSSFTFSAAMYFNLYTRSDSTLGLVSAMSQGMRFNYSLSYTNNSLSVSKYIITSFSNPVGSSSGIVGSTLNTSTATAPSVNVTHNYTDVYRAYVHSDTGTANMAIFHTFAKGSSMTFSKGLYYGALAFSHADTKLSIAQGNAISNNGIACRPLGTPTSASTSYHLSAGVISGTAATSFHISQLTYSGAYGSHFMIFDQDQ